ncbi:uncharacterized protein C20orf141 homolog [Suricata suricatta]|uniref:Chromosome 20 open reading frame 141 n=1 Tax=Suricata suricatta TaxID=37032 RepID=A0A673UE85_SURSU|nr:uncharacterized protein C20orf141 homolog [Suricata suricatta]
MTQICLPRPKALAHPIPVPPRGLGAGQESWSPVGPCMSPGGPNLAQLLNSVLGLGTLGLTIQAIFSTPGPAWLLLLLLVSFLALDLLHWPADAPETQHILPTGGQSQGPGEDPGRQEAVLLSRVVVPGRLSPQQALLLLLLGLGLLLGACGMPLALLGLAFCLLPWV